MFISVLTALAVALSGARGAQTPPSPDTAPVAVSTLEVRVEGVRDARGHVRVEICSPDQFLHSCAYAGDALANRGETIVTIHDVPPGTYASQVFHDENDSGRVERNVLGIPKEGVGFSNLTHPLLRAPRFSEAAFPFDGRYGVISLTLRYYTR